MTGLILKCSTAAESNTVAAEGPKSKYEKLENRISALGCIRVYLSILRCLKNLGELEALLRQQEATAAVEGSSTRILESMSAIKPPERTPDLHVHPIEVASNFPLLISSSTPPMVRLSRPKRNISYMNVSSTV